MRLRHLRVRQHHLQNLIWTYRACLEMSMLKFDGERLSHATNLKTSVQNACASNCDLTRQPLPCFFRCCLGSCAIRPRRLIDGVRASQRWCRQPTCWRFGGIISHSSLSCLGSRASFYPEQINEDFMPTHTRLDCHFFVIASDR